MFFSYCWSNSLSAVEGRQAPNKPGALGFGDPRQMKELLEAQGYSCWLDVEQVGQVSYYDVCNIDFDVGSLSNSILCRIHLSYRSEMVNNCSQQNI